jgi:hypothetical protein
VDRQRLVDQVVSELIGHASVAITLGRYGHLFPAALDDAAQRSPRTSNAPTLRAASTSSTSACGCVSVGVGGCVAATAHLV